MLDGIKEDIIDPDTLMFLVVNDTAVKNANDQLSLIITKCMSTLLLLYYRYIRRQMIRYFSIVSCVVCIVYTAKFYNELKQTDDKITEMLSEPTFMVGDQLLHEVSEFNDNMMDLVSDVRNKVPAGIKYAKRFYERGEPTFISFRYDSFTMKTKFGWNEFEMRQFVKLRDKSKTIYKYFSKSLVDLNVYGDNTKQKT